jgi:hypothetical protein
VLLVIIPVTVDDAPDELRLVIVLLLILGLEDELLLIPVTVAVDDNGPIVLLDMVMLPEVFESEIPVTVPPVPVDVKPVIWLLETASEAAELVVADRVNPVMVEVPVILLTVLFDMEEIPIQLGNTIPFNAPDPADQLLNVFPLIVFVLPASALFMPVNVEVPESVPPEKLLFVMLRIAPAVPAVVPLII